MTLARVAGFVGRALVAVGVLVLLFALHQLVGTGLQEAQAQDDLKDELRRALRRQRVEAREATPPPPAPGLPPAPTTTTIPPDPVPGEAVALLRIPRIGVDKAVVEGVDRADLRQGPGHYPGTPLPGQGGNAAIAGHRTTYGAPFYRLDQLAAGDVISVTTRQGEFRYLVDRTQVVTPAQVSVLGPTLAPTLTLTTCHPRFSARERLVVTATLQGAPAPSPPPEPPTPGGGDGGSSGGDGGGDGELAAAEDPALEGEPDALAPAALWGGLALVVAGISWGLGRAWKRWPAYLLGAPAVLALLFVCYEHLGRLLPANV